MERNGERGRERASNTTRENEGELSDRFGSKKRKKKKHSQELNKEGKGGGTAGSMEKNVGDWRVVIRLII